MDSEEETKQYTELTPVMLETSQGFRTEVKIPYISQSPEYTSAQNLEAYSCTNVNDADQTYDAEETNYSNRQDDDGDYDENIVYKGLVALYRGLPKEMFVNRILLNEASCESKLGEMRSSLFEHLKGTDDFPYGLQCMLKRRVCIRNGDSVAIKLAYDIHTLMSVIEGAEYTDMRELLSSGSGRSQRSQSTPSQANETIVQSDLEVKMLSDAVTTLKAELLHMKQTQTALETARSKEFQSMKSTMLGLKSDLTTLTNSVKSGLNVISLSVSRIESEKCMGVTHLKSELKTMKIQTKCMQDDIDALQSQISSSRATRTHRRRSNGRASGGKSVDDPRQGSPDLSNRHSVGVCGGAVDETVREQGEINHSATVNSNNELTDDASDVYCSQTEDPPGEGMAFSQFENNTVMAETSPDGSVGPTYTCVVENEPETIHRSDEVYSGRPINTRVTYSANRVCSEATNGSLSQHINGSQNVNKENDYGGFEKYVKKRAKRYYLGGFMPTVTREVITEYVTMRGPTVTWVSIWNSKRNPNNVVIRLNVTDNHLADMLEKRSFWPRGVTCRPWVDRIDRAPNRNRSAYYRGDSMRTTYGRSDIDSYNPFSPLRDHINLD